MDLGLTSVLFDTDGMHLRFGCGCAGFLADADADMWITKCRMHLPGAGWLWVGISSVDARPGCRVAVWMDARFIRGWEKRSLWGVVQPDGSIEWLSHDTFGEVIGLDCSRWGQVRR